jgi:hypothetical protein
VKIVQIRTLSFQRFGRAEPEELNQIIEGFGRNYWALIQLRIRQEIFISIRVAAYISLIVIIDDFRRIIVYY